MSRSRKGTMALRIERTWLSQRFVWIWMYLGGTADYEGVEIERVLAWCTTSV